MARLSAGTLIPNTPKRQAQKNHNPNSKHANIAGKITTTLKRETLKPVPHTSAPWPHASIIASIAFGISYPSSLFALEALTTLVLVEMAVSDKPV